MSDFFLKADASNNLLRSIFLDDRNFVALRSMLLGANLSEGLHSYEISL